MRRRSVFRWSDIYHASDADVVSLAPAPRPPPPPSVPMSQSPYLKALHRGPQIGNGRFCSKTLLLSALLIRADAGDVYQKFASQEWTARCRLGYLGCRIINLGRVLSFEVPLRAGLRVKFGRQCNFIPKPQAV